VPFSDFNAAPLEFPFTSSPEMIRGRFPGREFKLITDPKIPPQPESKPLSTIQEQALVKMVSEMKGEGSKHGTVQVQPALTPAPALAQLVAHLVASFEGYARDEIKYNRQVAVEVVGTFLINVFPELERELIAAGERAKTPAPGATRKAFKL
jgi:hypothetical protein